MVISEEFLKKDSLNEIFTESLQQFSLLSVTNIPLLHSQINQKVKLSLCFIKHHAMKTYLGSGGIAPRIDLSTR